MAKKKQVPAEFERKFVKGPSKRGGNQLADPVEHPLWDSFQKWVTETKQVYNLKRSRYDAFRSFIAGYNAALQ